MAFPTQPRHRNRKTKILATIGPASSSHERIYSLIQAGVDVIRLNFSHGTHDDHRGRYETIRKIEKEMGRPIGVLADLQGPKLRLGKFAEGAIDIAAGQTFRLDTDPAPGDDKRVCMPHPEIFEVLAPGQELLLDDGKVRLSITRCDNKMHWAETKVIHGTRLSDRKGVNVPHAVLPISALTPKDRADLDVALAMGVDFIALSFVQRPEDLQEARSLIGNRAALVAKIEKPSAISCLEELVQLSDCIMVARGDLGVEMPLDEVPVLQKKIVACSRKAGKPVIVATQMLESMIQAPAPTRAEVSDVANAVYDGADAVMLSAETASGSFPVEAVTIMDRVIETVEDDEYYKDRLGSQIRISEKNSADAITAAARHVADTLEAAAIVTFTVSGSTALRAARVRPMTPILCVTPSLETARRMSLCYGVHAVVAEDIKDFQDMADRACQIAKQEQLAEPGQTLVITAGAPFGVTGSTNSLRIVKVA
ncbi:MAG: pyruvate kinase [Alphaproteobacteria bacterium]|nr:MAG: pyruvate kinase [Alphaproteobacteria bacterium]